MIKKNKKQLILSSIIILLPVIAGLLMWNILPDRIATHWGFSGQADGWSSKAFAIFGLPFILLAGHWFCAWVTARDPKNKDQNGKVFRMVLWIFPITSLIACGATYAIALGMESNIDIMTRILISLMFVILGNYMPKCKQNHTIGIKVPWTLGNEENWNKTHRFAGKIWVLGGILLLVTLFIPLEKFLYAFVVIILLLAFVPMIYSYVYYRKQLQEGIVTKESMAPTLQEKKVNKISVAVGIVILILIIGVLFTGDFEVEFQEDSFTIEAGYWTDITVKYEDIDKIEYRKEDQPGVRTFGYGSLKLLMGEFENSEFGSYTRYSYVDCDSCIVLSIDDKILVINGENDEATQNIYSELTEKINVIK